MGKRNVWLAEVSRGQRGRQGPGHKAAARTVAFPYKLWEPLKNFKQGEDVIFSRL